MSVLETFAKRISLARRHAEETQAQTAEAIGTTAQSLSRYEKGDRSPDIETVAKLSKHFNVSADYLLNTQPTEADATFIERVCDYTGLSRETVELHHTVKTTYSKSADEVRKLAHFDEISNHLLASGYLYKLCETIAFAMNVSTIPSEMLQLSGIMDEFDQRHNLRAWMVHERLKQIAEQIIKDIE